MKNVVLQSVSIGVVLLLLLVAACATEPEAPPSADLPEQPLAPDSTPDEDVRFEVTEELYEQTFEEVEQVILRLNSIISEGDFAAWTGYLTPEYIEAITSPAHLAELNASPLLQRNNIVLEDLEDYFEYVVVPSRANLRLDDLEFIDDNTVQAIMIVRDRRAILYLLRRIDGAWRISSV